MDGRRPNIGSSYFRLTLVETRRAAVWSKEVAPRQMANAVREGMSSVGTRARAGLDDACEM